MRTLLSRQMLITLIPAVAMLLVLVAAHFLFQARLNEMTRDMAAIGRIHPLSGILSNLGILLWCGTAAICGFAAAVLSKSKQREVYHFLLYGALLTAYIALDDFFMIHERISRMYLGLNDKVIMLFLAIAVFIYLKKFRAVIAETKFGMLLIALGFLITAVVLDRVMDRWDGINLGDWVYFIEDSPKWLGIAFWCSYHVETSYRLVLRHHGSGGEAT